MDDNSLISHSRPNVGDEEIAELVACARSLQLKGGPRVQALERQIAADLGYAGAVATPTCAHAIHLLLRALFPHRQAVVGLPTYVCRSVHDAITLSGCHPQILDIDTATFSVSLADTKRHGPDAVVVPHMFGVRASVEEFQKAGLVVIEDCAQRVAPPESARQEPKMPFRVLSFEATKLMTSGEGGILLSDDAMVLERVRCLRDAPYDFAEPAVGFPLTDLQAAVALAQWKRLPQSLCRRRQVAALYLETVGQEFPAHIPPAMRAADTHHFRFVLRVDDPVRFMEQGWQQKIVFRRPVAPLCLHTLFHAPGDFPVAEDVFAHLVSAPIYPALTDAAAGRVVSAMRNALGGEGFRS